MVNVVKVMQLGGSIISIGASEGKVCVVDNLYNLYVLHPETFDIIKTHSLSKAHDSPHKYSHMFSISTDDHLSVPFVGTKKAVVVQVLDSIKKKTTIDWHVSDIEVSSFSKNGKYLATGGADGKVYIFESPNFKMITSLPKRSDYISALAFSNDNEFIAASAFDKFTVVFDLIRNKNHATIQTADVVERLAFFDNNQKLYLILRNGSSVVYDILEKKTSSTENHFNSWPNALDITMDDGYAVVGSRSRYLYIIKLNDNTKVIEVQLDNIGISYMKFFKDFLLVGYIDGNLVVIDYRLGENELEISAKVKNYRGAMAAIEKNLFLSFHPLNKIFDEDWPDILKQAIQLLNANKIEEACDLVEPFIKNIKRQQEFDFYMMQKGTVAAFAEAVSKRDFQKAFEMSTLNKYLTKTSAFMDLESYWNKIFNGAKKLLEENPTLNKRQAEAMLKPFEGTVKKDIVFQLLKNCNMFSEADTYIKNKNFKAYFSGAEKFPILKSTELYKKVLMLGEKMLDSLIQYDDDQKYKEAIEIAKHLSEFPPYKKVALDRANVITNKINFLLAIEKHDIKRVYAMVEKFEIFKTLPQFKVYQNDFNAKFEKCKMYAHDGNAKSVIFGMSIYMDVEFWKDRIASLLKIAYLNEIQKVILDSNINWDITLKRYIMRFGKDDELSKILKDYKLDHLLDATEDKGDAQGYRYHEVLDGIVVFKTQIGVQE